MTNDDVMVDVSAEGPRQGSWWRRRRGLVLAGGLMVVGLGAFVLVWFQPQKLFIDDRVDEELPGLVIPAAVLADAVDESEPMEPMDEPEPMEPMDEPEPMEPATLADVQDLAVSTGSPQVVSLSEFVRLDKGTEGVALLVAMPDGSLLVRFEGFRTGNGPDVYIELSRGGPADGDYRDMLRLGRMKGNVGDQNYEIPAGVDLAEYGSIIIWCERFRSAFGAAPLMLPV